MKNLNVRIAFVLGVTFLTAGARAQMNSNGYCVRLGEEAILENAVITVKNNKVNNSLYLSLGQRNHNFFDFENGSKKLYSVDWGGNFYLVKLAAPIESGKNIAVYIDYTHYGPKEAMVVECLKL